MSVKNGVVTRRRRTWRRAVARAAVVACGAIVVLLCGGRSATADAFTSDPVEASPVGAIPSSPSRAPYLAAIDDAPVSPLATPAGAVVDAQRSEPVRADVNATPAEPTADPGRSLDVIALSLLSEAPASVVVPVPDQVVDVVDGVINEVRID